MPTAVSSTDRAARADRAAWAARATRAVVDVGHLLRFRARSGRRRASVVAAASVTALTFAVAVVPAFARDAGGEGRALDVLILMPVVLAGVLLLAVVAAAASGGGRELLAREPAAIHPVSPTTDHLGALLLAPVNIAWLLQLWFVLGATAFGIGAAGLTLVTAQVVVLAWFAFSTAVGQLAGWSVEALRRTRHGTLVVRLLGLAAVTTTLVLQLSGRIVDVLDRVPTLVVVVAMVDGPGWRWVATVAALLALIVAVVALGAVPAHLAARLLPRDEVGIETGRRTPRRLPRSDVAALVRIDRGSVWRAVPMRRGVLVLALGPGVVALLGDLAWPQLTILPGLVASGGVLLYGVNAWCLDSRGALWRESLPVPPRLVFDARSYVLAEFLLAGSLLTVVVAGLRAGWPSPAEAVAITATVLVVTVQVVSAGMRWSAQHPYAVDLRSARATPAPPARMVVYSARLALVTTLTGGFFSVLADAGAAGVALLLAAALAAWSGYRWTLARRAWADPADRARVNTTVAGA